MFQQVSSYGPGQSTRTIDGRVPSHSIDDSHVANIGGVDRRTDAKDRILELSSRRSEHSLPPGATNTLFVEGLPSNCTRREVARILYPVLLSLLFFTVDSSSLTQWYRYFSSFCWLQRS